MLASMLDLNVGIMLGNLMISHFMQKKSRFMSVAFFNEIICYYVTIRMFPDLLIAGVLDFSKRACKYTMDEAIHCLKRGNTWLKISLHTFLYNLRKN